MEPTAFAPPRAPARVIWWLVWITLLAGGAALLIFVLLPYPQARWLGDLFARDGNLESLSEDAFARLRLPLRSAGIILLALGAGWRVFQTRLLGAIAQLPAEMRLLLSRLPGDTRKAFRRLGAYFAQREIWLPSLLLLLLALAFRLPLINLPMMHDESYTVTVFAAQPLRLALSDYHFPNNHLFHTFLVHIHYHLFGASPWAVRLPALLAGALTAPAGYWLARRLYGKPAALLAGISIAAIPVLIHYSVTARGYSLVALFTLLTVALGLELRKNGNLFFWLLLALLGALGLHTIPIFAYPLAMLYAWLGLVWLAGKIAPARRKTFLAGMLLSGTLTLGFALLLYLPVFFNTGPASVFANQWLEPLEPQWFIPTVRSRIGETWQEWTQAIPVPAALLLSLGWLGALFYHQKISREAIPLQAGMLILPLVVLAQRANPWPRLWLFLVPLVLIAASAGLAAGAAALQRRLSLHFPLERALHATWIIILLASGAWFSAGIAPVGEKRYGDVEQSVRYVREHLREGEIVVITAPEDAPLWFYFQHYGIPSEILRRDIPFTGAYILVSRSHEQTYAQVIRERGPDAGFFAFDTIRLVERNSGMDVYWIEADHNAIRRHYGSSTP
ncbi:MAG: glycosyltransferase family 39 protein [Chloroflexota bacterium]|jgi:hypothetical protein